MQKRRKGNNKAREQAKKRRIAIIRDGEKRIVIDQGNTKGYDLQMIPDFLAHLLLEVRVQHYEYQKMLKALEATDDLQSAIKKGTEVSETLAKQFHAYQEKYQAALVVIHAFDCTNATDAESKGVMTAILKAMLAKRDTQIGHLEALQDLFEEAFRCARLPFGVDEDGNVAQAGVIRSVREIADLAFLAGLPTYEELLPNFSDHLFATEKGIKLLKEHDRSMIIAANNGAYPAPLILYGADMAKQQIEAGKTTGKAATVSVSSFNELQFIIAAIRKFVGIPSTDGREWKDL